MYASGQISGGSIYHAQTREYLGRVGINDKGLFKASVTTCIGQGSEPTHLYYYGPNEYEMHHMFTLPDSVKNMWREKEIKNGYYMM